MQALSLEITEVLAVVTGIPVVPPEETTRFDVPLRGDAGAPEERLLSP